MPDHPDLIKSVPRVGIGHSLGSLPAIKHKHSLGAQRIFRHGGPAVGFVWHGKSSLCSDALTAAAFPRLPRKSKSPEHARFAPAGYNKFQGRAGRGGGVGSDRPGRATNRPTLRARQLATAACPCFDPVGEVGGGARLVGLYVLCSVVAGFEFARHVGRIGRWWLRWLIGVPSALVAAYALSFIGILITLRASDGVQMTGPASATAFTFLLGIGVRWVASMLMRRWPSAVQ